MAEKDFKSPTARRATAPPLDVEHAVSSGVTLLHHECSKGRGGWSAPQVLDRNGLVFVRRGGFHRRLDGREAFAGPAMAYFEMSGAEMQLAHPGPAGDGTSVYFLNDTAVSRLGGGEGLPDSPVVVGGAIDLAQRKLALAAEQGLDAFELDERVTHLIAAVVSLVAPKRVSLQRGATEAAHQGIARFATEAICADPASVTLNGIAASLAHSPYHVSRVFHRQMGLTMTRFRNKVRTSLAIERLSQGDGDLAGLAIDLGFHDQAHMTRVVRAEAGDSPGRIRSLISSRTAA